MRHLPIIAALTIGLLGTCLLHPAMAGAPTDVETALGTFQRMTPEYWITEPAVEGEAAITWKQVHGSGGLLELHETKSGAILMLDLADKVVAFVNKVSERAVSPDGAGRLAIFAADRVFIEGTGNRWDERPTNGALRKWDEVGRDEWSVYLRNSQRGEEAQLDLYQATAIITGGSQCASPCQIKLLTAGLASPITRVQFEQ